MTHRSPGGRRSTTVAAGSKRARTVLSRLRTTVEGAVIGPKDAEYDQARAVFYSTIDRHPAVIVRAAGASDVARVIEVAEESGLELAVRSGGHSVSGHGVIDGGVVLDLSSMRRIEIDAEARAAWAESGLTAGAYTTATAAHGLATGFGDSPTVGIGGITLGGGVGFLHRKYGLTIDSLLAAEVVTADGRIVHTDPENEPDLFWAIRGGGGNFGVATRLKFRLHPVDQVLGGVMVQPATPELVESFIAEAEAAPDELSGLANVMHAPPMPFIPPEQVGRPVLVAMLVYAGAAQEGERVLSRFRSLAKPVADMVNPIRYPQMYEGEGPHPAAVAVHTMFLDRVDRSAAETILEYLPTSNAPMRVAQLRVLGGAVARVPAEATAFAHRQRRMMANLAAAYERVEEAGQHREWVGGFARALGPGEPGAYIGFLGDEGEARVREAYPEPTWSRLQRVKARYDPDNLFRWNQNVPPLR